MAAPVISNLDGDFVILIEGGAPVLLDDLGDATVSDSDSPNFDGGSLIVSIAANGNPSEDVLLFDQSGTVSISGTTISVGGIAIGTITSDGTGGTDLVVAFNASATPARVQTLVRAIAYGNTNTIDPSTDARQMLIILDDGDGESTIVSTGAVVSAVNDAPAGADNLITTLVNDLYVFSTADFGFSDPDGNNLLEVIFNSASGGTLYVDTAGDGFDPGDAVAAFPRTVGAGLISGGQVAYLPNTVGSATGAVSFRVRDDGGNLNGGQDSPETSNTLTFDVTAASANPVLQLPDTLNYTENDPPSLVAPNAVLTDSDSPNFDGGTLTVSLAANGTSNDQLEIRNQGSGSGQIGVSGSDVSFAGTVIGTFTGGANGSDLVVTFDADATPAAVQALIRNITYWNVSEDPSPLPRSVSFTVTDGGGGSDAESAVINVSSVEDAAVARNDAFTIDEATTISGANLFDDNGFGPDTDPDDPFVITAVNNSGANVNNQITLASGALLTVNADGTFDYDPNGAFDPTPAADSGGVNQPAGDSFTYTITGGSTATVTFTINGLDTDDFVLGTGGDDILRGGVGNDLIHGLGGADTIRGGPGADTMVGGAGNDTYVVDNSGDIATEAGGGGFDIVVTSASFTLTAGSEVEIVTVNDHAATTPINLTSNELGTELWGNAGANTLTGEGGNDALIGFAGNDTLVGSGGDDNLDGGTGSDGMAGGSGNDIYRVDNALDAVIELTGEGNDTVFATVSYTLGAGSEVEILSAASNESTTPLLLTGNGLANQLWGTQGPDVLNGAGGADIMIGFGGNDVYHVDSASDVIIEGASGGNDIAYASVNYTLAFSVRVEVLAAVDHLATTTLDLQGNELSNEIWANNGANRIDGGGGADVLWGFGGADTFAFTTAFNFIFTGPFGRGQNIDTIFDMQPGVDKIALDDAVFTALPPGALAAGAFRTGSSAQDADDRIMYDPTTGALYYDGDGNGPGFDTLQFAILRGAPPITASDFIVI